MFSIIVLSRSEKMSNTTKSSLAASLKKLLEYKTLDRITISDITNNCGINRQTFYYHFDDLAGLVEWMFNDKISGIMRDLKLPDEWRKGLLMILQVLQENDSFVIQIYHSKINDRMYRFMFETCLSFITEVSDADMRKGNISRYDLEIAIRFFSYAFAGVMGEWFADDLRKPAERVAQRLGDIMETALPAVIRYYENS